MNIPKMILAIMLACCFALPAYGARRSGESTTSWDRWQEIGVLENCDAAPINSAVICGGIGGFKVEGYTHTFLEIDYTLAAGSGWEFIVESCAEGQESTQCTTAADWYQVPSRAVGTGTIVYTPDTKHSLVATGSTKTVVVITGSFRRIRLAGFVATGTPTASDLITVTAYVANLRSQD